MSAPDATRVPKLNQAAQKRVLVQFTGKQARLANVAGFRMAWTDGQPTGRLEFLLFVTQKYPAKPLTERDIIPPWLDHLVNPYKAQQGRSETAVRVVDTVGTHQFFIILLTPAAQSRTSSDTACPAGFSIGNATIIAGLLSRVSNNSLRYLTTRSGCVG